MQKTDRVYGLEPIYSNTSKVLILGTFPSEISRQKKEYYANKTNRFWKVIGSVFNAQKPLDTYADRLKILRDNDIALWDMISSCVINGSSDKSIRDPKFNDLKRVLENSQIELIVFNGKTIFEKYGDNFRGLNINYVVLQSTSSANGHFDADVWKDTLLSARNSAITTDRL